MNTNVATQTERTAFNAGFKSGEADRRLGRVSEVARISFATEPAYVRYYSAGYKAGLREVKSNTRGGTKSNEA